MTKLIEKSNINSLDCVTYDDVESDHHTTMQSARITFSIDSILSIRFVVQFTFMWTNNQNKNDLKEKLNFNSVNTLI